MCLSKVRMHWKLQPITEAHFADQLLHLDADTRAQLRARRGIQVLQQRDSGRYSLYL